VSDQDMKQWAAALQAKYPQPTGIAREARNRVCIDGHLNKALDDIRGCNGIGGPDAMFNLLGSLAGKAIDIALELASPPLPLQEGPTEYVESETLRLARQFVGGTDNQARMLRKISEESGLESRYADYLRSLSYVLAYDRSPFPAAVSPQAGEAKNAAALEALARLDRTYYGAMRRDPSHGFVCGNIQILDLVTVIEAFRAAPASLGEAKAVAPGWQVVPKIPTQEVHDAGRAALSSGATPMEKVYRAMLAAAPIAPALPEAADSDYAELYRWLREDRLVNEPISYPTFPWVVRCELAPWPTSMRLTGADLDSAIRKAMQSPVGGGV
jgi:hypothetical protein